MDQREILRIGITDDYGVVHKYEITQHPAEEGLEILPAVMRFIGGAFGPAVEMFGAAVRELNERYEEKDIELAFLDKEIEKPEDILEVIGEIRKSDGFRIPKGAGYEIQAAVYAVAAEIEERGPDFFRELVKYSIRAEEDGTNGVSLDTKAAFNDAFRGNYGEMAKVIGQILKVNYGPFLAAGLGNLVSE